MALPKPTPPQIDVAQAWLQYSTQNHGPHLELLRFSLAGLIAVLVLVGGFRIITDEHQQPDLQKLAIGLIGMMLVVSLSPLRRD